MQSNHLPENSSKILIRLLPTLTTLIVSLLLLTVGVIGSLVYVRTAASIDELIEQQFDAHVDATSSQVEAMLSPAAHILLELQSLARRGALPLDKPEDLSVFLIERLRANPDLAWVGWADIDNGYTAANRRLGNRLIAYQASPEVNDSLPSLFEVDVNGDRTAIFPPDEISIPYRPKDRPWFKPAISADGLLWHEPYSFGLGDFGISATLPFVPKENKDQPTGVFTVDFFLEDIVAFLAQIELGDSGRIILLTRDGAQIGHVNDSPILHDLVAAAAGDWFKNGTLPAGTHQILKRENIKYRVAASKLPDQYSPPWLIVIVVPERELTGVLTENIQFTLLASVVALLLALLLARVLSRRIAEPIQKMSDDLSAVGRFELNDTPIPQSYIREVAVLGDSIDRMKRGLRSFGRYIPSDVVRRLLAQGKEAQLGGEKRQLTIHFSDIAGFTSIAEPLGPQQTVTELADYFELMTAAITQRDGTVDKFMGDGILAFFNAPQTVPDHPVQACYAALEAQRRLAALRDEHHAQNRPEFAARIGLAMGEVLVGNIGTSERFAYTVMGDTVNLAARLESLNKYYGTSILATGELRDATADEFIWRMVDRVRVVGRESACDLYELVSDGNSPSRRQSFIKEYEHALQLYIQGDFDAALQSFVNATEFDADDLATRQLIKRCQLLSKEAAQTDWDGIYTHRKK